MGARSRTPLLLLLLASGCASNGCDEPDDPLARIVVEDALLEGLSLSRTAAFVGPVHGDADLVVRDDVDVLHTFPVLLDGTARGLAVHASAVLVLSDGVPLELPEPRGSQLTARELLGVYRGPTSGFDVGVGVSVRRLTNDADVVLWFGGLSTGLGVAPLAWEELTLHLVDDPAGR